ncbi:hypothetical protein [Shimia sp. R9_3]|uniref:hypothetical protein n=1 Tax=Shimia sp. R9_3 TaxID=2821113 RepID=UPI001ADBA9D2|nr:hypothetical protein [Shimia sp. R9_3]MBO9402629.1 hypothetical protein [Shimia sp. R9_3]
MQQVERFPARGFFRGTKTLYLRSLPEGAQLSSFRLRLTPIAASNRIGPAEEQISFTDPPVDGSIAGRDTSDDSRETAVSQVRGGGSLPWAEIHLGGFRTLSRLSGAGLAGATLQVDLGGLFVDVAANGTVPSQNGTFTLSDGEQPLPGLTVQRLRIARTSAGAQPIINTLWLRAVASNVTLAMGQQPAAWALPGELSAVTETTDLTTLAQAALDAAGTEGGFAVLPLHIKSDTTAQLAVEVLYEIQERRSGLPDGLRESTLEYTYDGVSEAGDDLLQITVPPNMEIDPAGTHIAIDGTFEGSEITLGPTMDRTPPEAVPLAVGTAAAQPVTITGETILDAVDVLLSTQARQADVKVDLREDFDGKPGDSSLLSQPATGSFGVSAHGGPRWLSTALGQTITVPADAQRIWLVVEPTSAPIAWHVHPETEPTAELQTSDTGGLSWRPARADSLPDALMAAHRFRRASPVFRVPVSAEIGRDAESSVLSLERFQPLGRVEFALESRSVAEAANGILSARSATTCPRGEQLTNGGFEDRASGNDLYEPQGWSVSGGAVALQSFSVPGDAGPLSVTLLRLGHAESAPRALSQIVKVSPGCPYRAVFRGFAPERGAVIELIWRQTGCGLSRTDVLTPPPFLGTFDSGLELAAVAGPQLRTILSASLDVMAPEDADQLEVRLRTPANQRLFVDTISLEGGPTGLRNGDFSELALDVDPTEFLSGWRFSPELTLENPPLTIALTTEGLTFTNITADRSSVILSQSAEVNADAPFAAALEAQLSHGEAVFAARWLDGAGAQIDTPLAASIQLEGAEITRLRGTVPAGAATAEIEIELGPNAILTLVAASAELEAPQNIPVSFLSEAPGRMTVRDFTVAFRPRAVATQPPPPESPCVPTPADTAPEDICECAPCKDKGETAPARATLITRLPTELPVGTIAQPRLDSVARLPRESATARLRTHASSTAFLSLPGHARVLTPATNLTLNTATLPDRPTRELHGIGEGRAAVLETAGITSVCAVARRSATELAQILDVSAEFAEDILSQARELTAGGSNRRR